MCVLDSLLIMNVFCGESIITMFSSRRILPFIFIECLFISVIISLPVVHGAMGCSQKGVKLELLSGFLAMATCTECHVCQLMLDDTGAAHISP